MPFKRKRFIFWYRADTHDQRLQQACTRSRADRPARKKKGLPRLRTSVSPGTFPRRGGDTRRFASLRSGALLKVLLPFRKRIWNLLVLQMSSTFGTVLHSKWVTHLEHGGATCGDGWRWRKNRVTDAICLVKASLVASRG